MPYQARPRGFEINIPLRLVRQSIVAAVAEAQAEDEDVCCICANAVCMEDECCRSLTHLACCTQLICCACVLKQAARCTCKEDCDAVVAWCPYCRRLSAVPALDVYRGQAPTCKACLRADAEAEDADEEPEAAAEEVGPA